ncbi:MAG: cytochrome c biogenesis protein ResB [Clostridia bacterium]
MKKILNFLRSMRFGILLLILIAAFSIVGSVIPQGRELSWYVENYPGTHPALLFLGFHRIFKSWYFVLLLVLLCLNLTLCSLVRVFSVVRADRNALAAAARMPDGRRLTQEGLDVLERHLTNTGCRREDVDGTQVYVKNRVGRYGSFLTHLAILLTVLFGAAALYLPRVIDRDCMPGESVLIPAPEGGTAAFSVASFRVTDDSGRLDFTSELTITLPDGRSKSGEISVNHPMSFGPWKVYQQSYGTAGSITVTNLTNGGSDTFSMADQSLLSIDGHDGVWYLALFPDYIVDPDGQMLPVDTGDRSYPKPVYYVQTVEGENKALRLMLPGDEIEIAPLRFTFNEPVSYPGLRIKHTPQLVNALLIACFVLMVAGLFLIFFLPPVLVKVDSEGYAVGGPKPEGTRLELQALLQAYTKEDSA